MGARRYTVDVTTDGSGAATVYTPTVRGWVASIHYLKDGANPFANGVDWVISDDITGEAVWTGTDVNASAVVRPRPATHDNTGAARLYAAGGTAVPSMHYVSGRIKIVVAQGGATKVGRFIFIMST